MSSFQGQFVWYELLTTDAEAARAFYGSVMGWQMADAGMSDRSYTILSVGATAMGGLMALPPPALAGGAHPAWVGYVAVDDVDVFVDRVTQAGGSVQRVAEDIPGVGRFAMVADPQGGVFVLFKGAGDAPPAVAPNTPGHTGWHELVTTEWQSAFAFYADLFGWTKADAIDMGPMGVYQLFAAGKEPIGGMMTRPPEMPVTGWKYYFNVDDIDAAAARVTQAAGKIVFGPMEVPGGMWVVNAIDPQGAPFALVGYRKG